MMNQSKSFSLSRKINFQFFLRIFLMLLSINIILFVMVISSMFLRAEKDTALLMESYVKAKDNLTQNIIVREFKPYHPYFSISFEDVHIGETRASALLNATHKYSPLKAYNTDKSMGFPKGSTFREILPNLKYDMFFPDKQLFITYEIGADFLAKKHFFYIFMIFELILLLGAISKTKKRVRGILQPLSDMTQQAQNLKTMSRGGVSAEEMRHLRSLAGTISSIDATKLDKRLPEDGPQKELKDLAAAINSMLDRIDEAYHSQVRFVSDASHELRTPIAVIQGYVNLLDRWGKNDEATTQEAIDALKSEADSMKDLVEQLLFLARGDNETLQLYPETFDVSQLVKDILKETNMINQTHTFTAHMEEAVYIHGDPQLMKQALRILMDNSIKYTPNQGEVIVSVSAENNPEGQGTRAKISIQDNGIGIEPESLPYIFDRFYRSDESRARKTGGSGLGLSIMKWIIDRHDGTIEVLSRKGIGTRTTIILPLLPPPLPAIQN